MSCACVKIKTCFRALPLPGEPPWELGVVVTACMQHLGVMESLVTSRRFQTGVRVDEHRNNTIPGAQVRRLAPPAKTQRDERCLVCTMLTRMGCLPAADVWPCKKRLQIVWETCSWLFFDRQGAMISTALGKAKNMTPVGHLFFRGGSRCGLISDS